MSAVLLHPALRDCRRLFLVDHEVQLRIGVHDFEQLAPQRLLIDIDLYVPLAASTPRRDRLDEVVDYDFVRTVVRERVGRGPIGLQETLVDELAATLLAHPQVRAVRIATRKPDVYADCAAVGVEVFRIKQEPAA
jgi:dihydroneopterin aldolase